MLAGDGISRPGHHVVCQKRLHSLLWSETTGVLGVAYAIRVMKTAAISNFSTTGIVAHIFLLELRLGFFIRSWKPLTTFEPGKSEWPEYQLAWLGYALPKPLGVPLIGTSKDKCEKTFHDTVYIIVFIIRFSLQ